MTEEVRDVMIVELEIKIEVALTHLLEAQKMLASVKSLLKCLQEELKRNSA